MLKVHLSVGKQWEKFAFLQNDLHQKLTENDNQQKKNLKKFRFIQKKFTILIKKVYNLDQKKWKMVYQK